MTPITSSAASETDSARKRMSVWLWRTLSSTARPPPPGRRARPRGSARRAARRRPRPRPRRWRAAPRRGWRAPPPRSPAAPAPAAPAARTARSAARAAGGGERVGGGQRVAHASGDHQPADQDPWDGGAVAEQRLDRVAALRALEPAAAVVVAPARPDHRRADRGQRHRPDHAVPEPHADLAQQQHGAGDHQGEAEGAAAGGLPPDGRSPGPDNATVRRRGPGLGG